MFTEREAAMNYKHYSWVCFAMFLATHSAAEPREFILDEQRISVWKKLAGAPLLMTLSVMNSQEEDENVLYVDQPIRLNVGIQNVLADALYVTSEPERRAVLSNGVDVAQASIKLCDRSRSWLSFVKVYIGVKEECITWCGELSSASNRFSRSNLVDANPVSVCGYIPELDAHHLGQCQIWAVFDNTSLNSGANPDLCRLRLKSNVAGIRVVSPTNEHQKAWVLAEKGSRARSREQYDAAESYLLQAIKVDPLLGRGPKIGRYRIFDLNWELGGIYESTGRFSDAASVVCKTRAYADRLPQAARDNLLEQVEERLSRYRKSAGPSR